VHIFLLLFVRGAAFPSFLFRLSFGLLELQYFLFLFLVFELLLYLKHGILSPAGRTAEGACIGHTIFASPYGAQFSFVFFHFTFTFPYLEWELVAPLLSLVPTYHFIYRVVGSKIGPTE
jgi:hypothetical protein